MDVLIASTRQQPSIRLGNHRNNKIDGFEARIRGLKTLDSQVITENFAKARLDFEIADVEETLNIVKTEAETAARLEAERKKAKETAGKTSEKTSENSNTSGNTSGSTSKSLNEEDKLLIELAPRLPDIITDMWNTSSLHQGWEIVAASTENKYGARLATLSRTVYSAYRKTKGSSEGLQELIKTHTPRQTAPQNLPNTPPATPPGANQTQQILPQGPNSGSNQGLSPNTLTSSQKDALRDAQEDSILKYVSALPADDSR